MKKIVALALAALMLVTLVACGSRGDKLEYSDKYGYVFKNENKNPVDFGTPEKTPDAEAIYAALTYTPEMLHGNYMLEDEETALEQYKKDMDYMACPWKDSETKMTAIPYQMKAGRANLNHSIHNITDKNWCELYFQTEDGYLDYKLFAYEVQGNKLVFTALKNYEIDKEAGTIEYSMTDAMLEYEFKLRGLYLTLSAGGKSVTLRTGLSAYGTEDILSGDGYLIGGNGIDGITCINFLYSDREKGEDYAHLNIRTTEDSYSLSSAVAAMTPDGLFTMTVPWETGTKTYQFVYLYDHSAGVILTDGENFYDYSGSYWDHYGEEMNRYIAEDQTGTLASLTEEELEKLYNTKNSLMEALASAFEAQGIAVSVDTATGELAMDSAVLFGGDSAVLSDEGKAFLDKFVNAYTSVVFTDEYKDFVAKTMVEGHIAPVAGVTYDGGMALSVQRADNVKNYCASQSADLAAAMESVGYSNSKPITDKNGQVDMDASRRVSFRFIIDLTSFK